MFPPAKIVPKLRLKTKIFLSTLRSIKFGINTKYFVVSIKEKNREIERNV